jgi:Tfp pilus assembly protein PilV
MGNRNAGYTMIETLISSVIILAALIFLLKIIIYSLHWQKQAYYRFHLEQTHQSLIQQLLATPFSSKELQEGQYSKKKDIFTLRWQIFHLDPGLKKITLKTSCRGIKRQSHIYRSKYLKNRLTGTGQKEEKHE